MLFALWYGTTHVLSAAQVDKFMNGSIDDRIHQLELVIQVQSHEEGMSWLSWLIILVLSVLVRLSFSGHSPPAQSSKSGDRTVLPALRLSSFGGSHHFGGSLQHDRRLPRNYAAHVLHVDSKRHVSLVRESNHPTVISELVFSSNYPFVAGIRQCVSS